MEGTAIRSCHGDAHCRFWGHSCLHHHSSLLVPQFGLGEVTMEGACFLGRGGDREGRATF